MSIASFALAALAASRFALAQLNCPDGFTETFYSHNYGSGQNDQQGEWATIQKEWQLGGGPNETAISDKPPSIYALSYYTPNSPLGCGLGLFNQGLHQQNGGFQPHPADNVTADSEGQFAWCPGLTQSGVNLEGIANLTLRPATRLPQNLVNVNLYSALQAQGGSSYLWLPPLQVVVDAFHDGVSGSQANLREPAMALSGYAFAHPNNGTEVVAQHYEGSYPLIDQPNDYRVDAFSVKYAGDLLDASKGLLWQYEQGTGFGGSSLNDGRLGYAQTAYGHFQDSGSHQSWTQQMSWANNILTVSQIDNTNNAANYSISWNNITVPSIPAGGLEFRLSAFLQETSGGPNNAAYAMALGWAVFRLQIRGCAKSGQQPVVPSYTLPLASPLVSVTSAPSDAAVFCCFTTTCGCTKATAIRGNIYQSRTKTCPPPPPPRTTLTKGPNGSSITTTVTQPVAVVTSTQVVPTVAPPPPCYVCQELQPPNNYAPPTNNYAPPITSSYPVITTESLPEATTDSLTTDGSLPTTDPAIPPPVAGTDAYSTTSYDGTYSDNSYYSASMHLHSPFIPALLPLLLCTVWI